MSRAGKLTEFAPWHDNAGFISSDIWDITVQLDDLRVSFQNTLDDLLVLLGI
jgi:hypothetical protein